MKSCRSKRICNYLQMISSGKGKRKRVFVKLLEIAIAVHIDEKMRSNWDPIGSLSNLIKVEVDFRRKLILRVLRDADFRVNLQITSK